MATKYKERPADDVAGAAAVVANRADLIRAATVASVVEARNTIPICSNMLIDACADGLALTATDLDIEVRVMVPATVDGAPLGTTVSAKKLAALVGSAEEGCQVKLALEAGAGSLDLRAGRGRYKLPVLPREDFPRIDFPAGERAFAISAKALGEALARTSAAECKEQTRYYLIGTALATRGGRLLAVATNGHMLAEVDMADAPADWPLIIVPSKATAMLVRMLKDVDGEVSVALDRDAKRIRFEWGDWTVTSKLIDGSFPDWGRVIPPARGERAVIVDSGELQKAIRRVGEMANEKTRSVLLTLSSDRVVVSCQSPEIGAGDEEVAASCPIDALQIRVNATYLRDIAASASGDSVAFEFGDSNDPVRVVPSAAQGFVGVLMPMRV